MLTPVRLMTVRELEDYVESPAAGDRWFELIAGQMVQKMPNEEHGDCVVNLLMALGSFVKPQRLGRLVVEALYRSPDDELNAFQPDIAFTSKARQLPLTTRGAAPLIPDLCVEIKSPGNKVADLRSKAAYYLAHGGRLVWLVYPKQKIVEVYTQDADVSILTETDVLTGGEILPGFELPVRDIFAVDEDIPNSLS